VSPTTTMDQESFLTSWKNNCLEIDRQLDKALSPKSGIPGRLLDAMRYSVLGPGKRLRPLLVLLGANATGITNSNPWPAACSVEFIHAYSLIHDDLPAMDDDDLRRGRPTCHKVYGEALAILAGDALLTMAFEILADGYPGQSGAQCCLALAKSSGAAGMVGGQVVDLAWEGKPGMRDVDFKPNPSENDLKSLHLRKTGALIQASLRLGAISAYASEERMPPLDLLETLDCYGQKIGLAFQVTDDLLDVEGKCEAAGKRVGKDAEKGKLTYPGLIGVEASRNLGMELCSEARKLAKQLGPEAEPLSHLADYIACRDR
jgi:geranylgeranyl diphosphate synthase type II